MASTSWQIRFPKLADARMEWHSKMSISDACRSLKVLSLRRYKPKSKDLREMPTLPRLEDLAIVQSPLLTIDGVDRLQGLRRLELAYLTKLERIGAVAGLKGCCLQILEFEKCGKILDHEIVGGLRDLRVLRMSACGEVPSIAFVKDLKALEHFSFVGTNVLDGDLRPLLKLPRLRHAGFTNKRHFSHRYEELNSLLKAKNTIDHLD